MTLLEMALLELDQVSVGFGARAAVAGVSLSIAPGERFGLIGESGSGKTLTALAVMGLLPETARREGTIRFAGAPMPQAEREMARLRGRRIGMVFQEPMSALNPLMRAGAQIGEALTLGGAEGTVAELLEEVGLEQRHAERYPHQLSGGQRQRVGIAMALAGRPELLIADEPTSALDLITQARVLEVIEQACARRGMALLFISHDLRAVARLASRVAVMKAGRIVEAGPAEAVLARPEDGYTRQLVAAARPTPREGARAPVGDVLVKVTGLTRRFRERGRGLLPGPAFAAVDGVDFSIRQAESLALVGPSGCGKTTLARILAGLDTASAGGIEFAAHRYRGADLPKALRRDISLVFQDPFSSFNPRLTLGTSLAEPLRLEPALTPAERRARLETSVLAVGLEAGMLSRYPHEFSGGQRQRLAIARALVTRPRFLVLDEPVSALDMSVRADILALLMRLQAEFGLTYLVISHDLDMVRTLADRVLIMETGRIVEEGQPAELFARPRHRLTQELVAARLPEIGG